MAFKNKEEPKQVQIVPTGGGRAPASLQPFFSEETVLGRELFLLFHVVNFVPRDQKEMGNNSLQCYFHAGKWLGDEAEPFTPL